MQSHFISFFYFDMRMEQVWCICHFARLILQLACEQALVPAAQKQRRIREIEISWQAGLAQVWHSLRQFRHKVGAFYAQFRLNDVYQSPRSPNM